MESGYAKTERRSVFSSMQISAERDCEMNMALDNPPRALPVSLRRRASGYLCRVAGGIDRPEQGRTHHFKLMARPKRKSGKRSDNVPSARGNSRAPRSTQSKSGGTAQSVSHSGSGLWDAQKWLIGKKLAHVVNKRLVAAEASQERRDDADGKAKKIGRRSKPIVKRLARRKSI